MNISSNNIFNRIVASIRSKIEEPKIGEKGKALFKETLKGVDFAKTTRFFKDESLGVSLRRFNHQVTDYTHDIYTSKLPDKEKIASLKTSLQQLKSAIEGRKSLLSNPSILQKAEFLLLHGKTVQGLQKSVVDAEARILILNDQISTLEKKQADRARVVGKPLPSVPEKTLPSTEKLSVEQFAAYLTNPAYKKQLEPLVPIMASVYGVSESCNELRKVIPKEIEKNQNKEEAVKNGLNLVTQLLKSIPPTEFEKKEKLESFLKLAVELYKQPSAANSPEFVSECNKLFGQEQFQNHLKSLQNNEEIDQTALAKLGEHAHAAFVAVEERPPRFISYGDLYPFLLTTLREENKKNYETSIMVLGQALYEDSLSDLKKLEDSGLFDPLKVNVSRSFAPLENKIKTFLLQPNNPNPSKDRPELAKITLAERSKRAEIVLDLIKYNFDHKNYEVVAKLFPIISSSKTLDAIPVSSSHAKFKEQLKSFLSHEHNHQAYREQIKKDGETAIPYMGLNIRDLNGRKESITSKSTSPTLSLLQSLANSRTDFLKLRDRVKQQPSESFKSFLSPKGAQEALTLARRQAIQAGYGEEKADKEENIERLHDHLVKTLKEQLKDQGIIVE